MGATDADGDGSGFEPIQHLKIQNLQGTLTKPVTVFLAFLSSPSRCFGSQLLEAFMQRVAIPAVAGPAKPGLCGEA
jgi:hypothetical protein